MKRNLMDFIIVIMIVSYDYLRMLGMNNKIVLIGYLLLLILFSSKRIFTNKITRKELIKITLLFIVGCFSTIVIDEVNIIITILASIYFLKTDDKIITKYFLLSLSSWYILVIILYSLGILDSNNLIRITQDENIIRNSLGFSHVNQTFLYFLPILFSSYILYFDNNKKKFNILFLILSTILFIITNSRTGFFSVLIFILVININTIKKRRKSRCEIISFIYLLLTILSIYFVKEYGSNGSNYINSLLSLRPYYLYYYLNNNSLISLVGGAFITNIPMDNVYIYLLLEKGIIIYLFYLFIYYFYFSKCDYDNKIMNIIIVSLIYGLFESYIVLPSINFILIIMLIKLIKNNKKKE